MRMFKTFYKGAILLLLAASCNETGRPNRENNSTPELSSKACVDSATTASGNPITEDYESIVENNFVAAEENPLSTFSIDVDDAAYSNVRRYLQNGQAPPPAAVRIEEMINYFDYDYAAPLNDDPFAVHTEISSCPWNEKHRLVHIGIKGKEIATDELPPANLVFLIDVSGSMNAENKLPLVKASLKLLTENYVKQTG